MLVTAKARAVQWGKRAGRLTSDQLAKLGSQPSTTNAGDARQRDLPFPGQHAQAQPVKWTSGVFPSGPEAVIHNNQIC